jgi:hypothetical protein
MKTKIVKFKNPSFHVESTTDSHIIEGMAVQPVIIPDDIGKQSLVAVILSPVDNTGNHLGVSTNVHIQDVPNLLQAIKEVGITPKDNLSMLKESMTGLATMETVAELSRLMWDGIYDKSGDMADVTHHIIQCAFRFEEIHLGVKWGVDDGLLDESPFPYDEDYYLALESHAKTCLNAYPQIP